MPTRMCRGTPSSVWKAWDFRAVGRTVRSWAATGTALGQRLAGRVHQGAHPGCRVDVGHRDGGVADAQGGHELRGGQRAAAVGEEVGVEAGDRAAQHGAPLLHDPLRVVRAGSAGRRRPRRLRLRLSGQGRAWRSTLPLVLVGSESTSVSSGISGAGRLSPSSSRAAARSMSRPGTAAQVADQDLVAGRRGLHRGGRAGDVRQRLQGGVDFAELDPAAAELDLFVGAALEDQALGLVADQVAASGRRASQPRDGIGAYFSASLAGSR